MDGLRSRSYADGRAEKESSYAASGLHMVRSYSASHRSAPNCKKGKSTCGSSSMESSSSSSSSSFVGWGLISDPELQRKTRVAGYKVYAVEGKMKGSVRKSFRWIKDKYTQVLYGRF
ncbi:hypothetical protein ACMD2_22097 [Ananas comosus]|uniref:DUF3511 domain-containing protein n=1 Tax=Ananas comosus TaxID=4615 RepID=A0A199VEQ4_ANACO|nr:hypothetical protein ACMD2_22097 [Ananas comosus]